MKTIILLFVISLISFKGFSQKPFSYLRNKTKVDKIIVLPPLTLINVINENGEEYYDSTLTHYTNRQVVNVLKSSFPDSVQISNIDFDSVLTTNILSFIDELNREIFYESQLKKFKVSNTIFKIFNAAKTDYIFGTCYFGIKRVTSDLTNRFEKKGELDYFFKNKRPFDLPAALNVCFIINLKESNILFYEKNLWYNRDPTDIKIINLMLGSAIKHCFLQ